MATHNRRDTTLRCLRSLLAAARPVDLNVVHVDDASSDGTAEAVAELLPDVVQLRGDGGRYWAGGMRLGLERADRDDPDYVLWLNDDVVLNPDALDRLLELAPSPDELTIAVGALRDPDTAEVTYATARRVTSWRGATFVSVPPGTDDADVMNGNLVLVPRRVRQLLGNLDPAYRHAMADYDYGLRATRSGVRIRSTPTTVGTCARNSDAGTWRDPTLSRRERLRVLNAPTGRPIREWAHFQRRNGGNWPAATLSPFVRTLVTPTRGFARSRPEVSIVYKSLPHYRVPLYEALRDQLDGDGVDLRLLIGDPPVGEPARRDTAPLEWAELVPQRELPIGQRRLVWQRVLGRVRRSDLVIVEQASKLLVNNVLALWRHVGGPALGLWGHGVNRDARHRSGFGEWWKRRTITDCDWWFAYTAGTADLVAASGFPRARITDLRNATDTRALREAAAAPVDASLPGRIHDGGAHRVAFIGSLYAGKGLAELVTTVDRVRDRVGDVELVVVGDGEDRAILEEAANRRPWIQLLGPRTGVELVEALRGVRCVLCPAAVGLVVLDAFALGIPVVVARADNHGPEIDYVGDGDNGLVVDEPAAHPAYADAVVSLLLDDDLRDRLVRGCAETARTHDVEEMARRFADGILKCLGRR